MARASAAFRPFEHAGMYDFLASVRGEVPVFHAPDIDYWVVTRRSDVEAILPDSERFSADIATRPLVAWPDSVTRYLEGRGFTNEAVQVACDPPRHGRIQKSARRFLNLRQFRSYEDRVRGLVRARIEAMRGRDRLDLVESLTYEFPAQVVFLLLGVGNFDPARIKAWGDLRLYMIWGEPGVQDLDTAARDLADFWDFTVALVEARKREPGDDYPSRLLEARGGDDAVLTENEICSLVFGLLLAGHETTTNATGNLLLEVLSRPGLWAEIAADPSLARNTVEEGLRYASSVVAWRRRATRDVRVGDVDIPAGSRMLLSLGSANRDPAKFDDPETFDIRRPNAQEHIAFGKGLHHCAGAPLARMELRAVLEELTAAFPDMALDEDVAIDFTRTLSFRGPTCLPVRPGAYRTPSPETSS